MVKNVLIIEDEEELLNLLKYSFEILGYSVKTAKNINEAKNILKDKKTNLIISDIFISDKNIMEEIVKIREINPKIKFIITTAFDEVESEIKKNKFDYFIKPYKIEKIVSKIKSFSDN